MAGRANLVEQPLRRQLRELLEDPLVGIQIALQQHPGLPSVHRRTASRRRQAERYLVDVALEGDEQELVLTATPPMGSRPIGLLPVGTETADVVAVPGRRPTGKVGALQA